MKLSLTVEADAINVLALNMGRIAVDIDCIELAELRALRPQRMFPVNAIHQHENLRLR